MTEENTVHAIATCLTFGTDPSLIPKKHVVRKCIDPNPGSPAVRILAQLATVALS